MSSKRYYYFFLIPFISALIIFSGCKKGEDNPVSPVIENESLALAQYLEANGDFLNSGTNIMVTAEEVRQGQLTKAKQVILDLRSNCDFHTLGHIEGAVHIFQIKDIPWYYNKNNLASMDKVIITCGSGQYASYTAVLLRLAGYKNVYAMKWGMSSWNKKQDVWSSNLKDEYSSSLVKNNSLKNSPGNMPFINTGKTSGAEILSARFQESLIAAFEDVEVSAQDVFNNLSDYYIINYAALESYLSGHIPNAVQYTPNQDLRLSTFLNTLPADKKIAVYCYTGQTSAQAAAFLRLLGYKVKTILYGNNGINYSSMSGSRFSESEIHDYPYIH